MSLVDYVNTDNLSEIKKLNLIVYDIIEPIFRTYNETVLMRACSNGNFEIVKYLIENIILTEETVKLLWEPNIIGQTILLCAASSSNHEGSLQIIKYFVKKFNLDLNALWKPRNGGSTILADACSCGNLKLVKWLVRFYFKKDICANYMLRNHKLHDEVSQYVVVCGILKKNDDGKTPFHMACECGRLDIVTFLVKKLHLTNKSIFSNIYISDSDNSNRTTLMLACRNGHLDVIKYLIDVGNLTKNDILKQSHYGSALSWSLCRNETEIIKYLKEKFSLTKNDIMIPDIYGTTPLCKICDGWNVPEMVKYIISEFDLNKNDILKADHYNNTALSKTKNMKIKLILLSKICDIIFEPYEKIEKEQCCICLENNSNCKTKCKHNYCLDCYANYYYIYNNNNCALCRSPIDNILLVMYFN